MNNSNENLNLILLNIGYSELNANWNWKKIHSPFARLYYVKEGRAKTHIGDKTYDLEPNHLYLTPPFTMHDDECDSLFSLYYIHFYEKVISKEFIFDKYDFPISVAASDLDLSLTLRLMDINPDRHLRYFDPQLYDNAPTFSKYIADSNKMTNYHALETHGILCQLLSKFLKGATPKTGKEDVRIEKSLKHIHENIDEYITVASLAKTACMSEDHFIRLFKQASGTTPLKYMTLKKIEKAQLLILTTDLPIRDIAFELSIDSPSYFNRIFKQHTGKTPTQYREEYNG